MEQLPKVIEDIIKDYVIQLKFAAVIDEMNETYTYYIRELDTWINQDESRRYNMKTGRMVCYRANRGELRREWFY